jgi:hypothetical protein
MDLYLMSLRGELNDRREFDSTKQSVDYRQGIASSSIRRFAPHALLAMTKSESAIDHKVT